VTSIRISKQASLELSRSGFGIATRKIQYGVPTHCIDGFFIYSDARSYQVGFTDNGYLSISEVKKEAFEALADVLRNTPIMEQSPSGTPHSATQSSDNAGAATEASLALRPSKKR
jgi:hypothetical protein